MQQIHSSAAAEFQDTKSPGGRGFGQEIADYFQVNLAVVMLQQVTDSVPSGFFHVTPDVLLGAVLLKETLIQLGMNAFMVFHKSCRPPDTRDQIDLEIS